LLLDQMIDTDVASTLQARGYDVVRVAALGMSRAGDDEILAAAIDENRILVTLDEDFGDWCVLPLDHHAGVIRIKAKPAITSVVESLLLRFLKASEAREFANMLAIVGEGRVRWIRTGGWPSR
jgi:predicted nuclease of predicted toxin-antitoxin system